MEMERERERGLAWFDVCVYVIGSVHDFSEQNTSRRRRADELLVVY
jgi:hypothetical protein